MAHVSFTGNTTGDAELRFTPDGKAVLNLSVAENHSKFNKQTNQYEDTGTTFRRVALWGKKAEHLADQIGKGSMVHVSGREETRAYTTRDGVEGTSLEVTADDVGLIYAKNGTPQQGGQQQGGSYKQGGYVPSPQGGFQQQRPQQQTHPQGQQQSQQADPWGQQGAGNYSWGEQGNDVPL